MKPIIFNAIDKLYNEKTGMIVPVSAAVGGNGPQPEPIQFNSTVTYTELSADNWKLEIVPEWPEGINFDVLNTLYPNWLGEIDNGIIIMEFNSDSITENYVTIENITFGEVPAEGTTCLINLKNGDGILAESTASAHIVEIPVPVEKFTLDSVVLDGPTSAGPYSNAYAVMMSITFTDTPPTNWDQTATCTCTNACVADTTGEIKDTGEYTFTGFAVNGNLWETNDPAYPYDSPLGPATVTIYDENNDVWGTATTDNVTIQTIDNL